MRVSYIAPGTPVTVDGGNIKGVVQAVEIDARGVSNYLVRWYDDGVRYCEWCDPDEVEPAED